MLHASTLRLPRLSLAAVWMVLPIVLIVMVVWTNSDYPVDFWMHVNLGQAMAAQGQLVTVDSFTHTIAGQPVLNQAWLAQLVTYGLFEAGGYALVQFVFGLLYAVAFGLLARVVYTRTGHVRLTAGLVLLAVSMSGENFGVRPQVFSAVLFSLLLTSLYRPRIGVFSVVAVGLIELAWVNLHGAFPLGIVVPGLFLVGRCSEVIYRGNGRRLYQDRLTVGYFACCMVAMMAMCFSPQGLDVVRYVSGVTAHSTSRQLQEWLPPTLGTITGNGYFLSIVAVICLMGFHRGRASATDLLVLVALLVLAARSQRMVIWWAMALPVVLAPYAKRLLSAQVRGRVSRPDERTFGNVLGVAVLVLVVLVSTPWTRTYNRFLPESKRSAQLQNEPRGAARYLQSLRPGTRLYQPMEWGAFFTWATDNRSLVFVDSRVDFFPDSVWRDYVLIGSRPDMAERLLDAHHVDVVVWDRRRGRLLTDELARSSAWQKVYVDRLSVVFRRCESDGRSELPSRDQRSPVSEPSGSPESWSASRDVPSRPFQAILPNFVAADRS